MNRQFETLAEAYQLLNWDDKADSLQIIRRNLEENRYFIAFIGQFSAGKSCLINNLLEKEILPSGVRETTPILTYIRYGANEYALLHFTDGSVWKLSLSEVHTITQNSSNWNPDQFDYLEIFVCAPILQSGMVLLDTPGINTLIRHHEQLLSNTLDLASRVIYVVGHAPQKTDVDTMQMIASYGMELAYVRTHFDEINPSEESFEETIRQDISLMESCSILNGNCFHVSNRPNSQWYENIQALRALLSLDGTRTIAALQDAISNRLHTLVKNCLDALIEKKYILEDAQVGNWEACSRKLEECNSRISQFDHIIEQQKRELNKDLRNVESDILCRIRLDTDCALNQAVTTIRGSTVSSPRQMTSLMEEQTHRVLGRMMNSINNTLAPYLNKLHSVLDQEQFSIDWSDVPQITSYNELCETQNAEHARLVSQLEYLRNHRCELDHQLQTIANDPAYLSLQEELIALEQELQEYTQSYNSIPPYTPQMVVVEDGRMQPSQIAKTIGSLVDWGLMLIPGTAITGAIKNVASSTKTVSKIAQVIGKSEKIMKAIENADKIRDVIFAVNNMSKTYATKARKEKAQQFIADTSDRAEKMIEMYHKAKETLPPTFLDYLTVEHWATQIGKQFDSPPKLTIDREYEQQYQQAKSAIEGEILERQRRSYDIKYKQQLFMNEQERVAAEQRVAIIDERAVADALEKKKAEITSTAQKLALHNWKNTCCDWYRSQMSAKIENLLQEYMQSYTDRLQRHFEDSISPIRDQLSASRAMYTQLLQDRDSAPEELLQVSNLITQLRVLTT